MADRQENKQEIRRQIFFSNDAKELKKDIGVVSHISMPAYEV